MSQEHKRTYETDTIRVRWDSSRCIHTGICLRTLPSVFDTRRRPWVDIQGAEADAVATAVGRCPTGALRYERLDEEEGERPRRPTVVWPIEDGPLLMAGDLEVKGADGQLVTHETRLTFCRCGLSHNQPFCDNSHLRRNWKSGPSEDPPQPPLARRRGTSEQRTTVVARRDGPLEVSGDLAIYHSDGREMADAGLVLLCRCGQSANKPFCDGTHERVGFFDRPAEATPDRLEAESPAAFQANLAFPDSANTRGE
jgi:CDGSH-type Zn-finger protein/uncharacterized Fe-S cluster protein YjdI